MLVFQSLLSTSLNADPESKNRRYAESEMIPNLRGDESRAFDFMQQVVMEEQVQTSVFSSDPPF
jgi:hypothetical protein